MPLALSSLSVQGPAAADTVVWRHRGQLSLTVVVKATFALVSEGRMTLVEPDPIVSSEQPSPSGRGLHAAGDLAPYLGHADVWLVGHAEVPPHYAESRLHVAMMLMQEGVARINKKLDLDAMAGPGRQGKLPIHGLDPISRVWPARRKLLEGLDPRAFEGPVVELPDRFDWRYFHAVPEDQRLESVTGHEWLVLGGMLLRRPRFRTQLPEVQGVARLFRRAASGPRQGEPIPLRADMIQIDVDRLRCAIVWRGHVRLQGDAELAGVHVVGAVAMPGETVVWADPYAIAPQRGAAPVPVDPQNPLGSTVALSGEDAAVLLESVERTRPREAVGAAGTLAGTGGPAVEPQVGETAMLTAAEAARVLAEVASLPFKKPASGESQSRLAAVAPPALPPRPYGEPLGSSGSSGASRPLARGRGADATKLAAVDAMVRESAVAMPLLGETSTGTVTAELLPGAAAVAMPFLRESTGTVPASLVPQVPISVTPFRPPLPGAKVMFGRNAEGDAPPGPRSPPSMADAEAALGGTLALRKEQQAQLSHAAATPFEGKPMPAPPLRPSSPGMPAVAPPMRPSSPGMPAVAPPMRPSSPGMPAVSPPMRPSSPGMPAVPPGDLDFEDAAGTRPAPVASSGGQSRDFLDVVGTMAGPPVLSADEIAQWPPGLGATFLAAMAEAGALSAP
ncbi:DUF2169 domain-containing protein [Chondromyces crocatus]|uniref:DUF2169 domain-containing protein n=1 Tax=Chondromyces crocatus TaxID=52 RepID=A0A0K1E7Q8_CHOCO|nr:DUF2169 domain-containing protein [Chondromyces crocatus]AKT36921.1 uncharacterized protein CMC5_010420 [Chondromyces crocatus]